MNAVLSVSQINFYLKSVIDYDDNLKNIFISGEISNFTNHYRSGHFYFTLKDDTSAIKAVMFSRYAQNVKFEPYDGLKVLIRGSVSVFERDGVYQLYVTDMMPEGIGELSLAFEQLKEKLEKEGLFLPEHKKALPEYPERIAVITSPTGAALQDVINVISRRYPCCELILFPVHVQGEQSSSEIVHAIEKVNQLNCADVIILGRGGGSAEDLMSFNSESVARSIFAAKIPIISAVGHETDITISDLVADRRAPTPSAAAEIATPDSQFLFDRLASYKYEIISALSEKTESYRENLDALSEKIAILSPQNKLNTQKEYLTKQKLVLEQNINRTLKNKTLKLSALASQLDALSPLKTLSRGYAIVYGENDEHISSAEQLKADEKIKLKMKDATAVCTVNEVIL